MNVKYILHGGSRVEERHGISMHINGVCTKHNISFIADGSQERRTKQQVMFVDFMMQMIGLIVTDDVFKY